MPDEKFFDMFNPKLELEQKPEQEKRPAFTRASDVTRTATRFLWKPYLPLGYVSTMQASGGTGKSFLVCGIIAELSRGNLPFQENVIKPAKSLFVSAEDSESIIAGRLSDCGADLDRCVIMDLEKSRGINFHNGDRLDEIESIVKSENIKFIVIDPLHAFIGDVDMNRANIVRPIMQTFSSFAERYDLSLLLISHVSKRKSDFNSNDNGLGSVDIVNASRSVLQIVGDETGEDASRRSMVHTKSNYKELGRTIAYRINSLPPIQDDNGDEIDRANIEWIGFTDLTKDILEASARSRSSLPEYMKKHNDTKDPVSMDDYIVNIFVYLGEMQQTPSKLYPLDYFRTHHSQFFGESKIQTRVTNKIINKVAERGYIVEFLAERKTIDGKLTSCLRISKKDDLDRTLELFKNGDNEIL